MALAATVQSAYIPRSAYEWRIDDSFGGRFGSVFTSDAIRSTMSELTVGETRYPLRAPCGAKFIPGQGQFLVDGFSPTFVGNGDTIESARQDWLLAVHFAFQELLYKRPFEMTEVDRCMWNVLSSHIDVAVYRNQTPIQLRQFGRISKSRPYPTEIEWEDGVLERINIDQVGSPDFVTYKPGQPFEAVVTRDPLTYRLLQIVHIERRALPERLSVEEEAALLKSSGSAKQLPAAGWE